MAPWSAGELPHRCARDIPAILAIKNPGGAGVFFEAWRKRHLDYSNQE
jgi:hypothetical protein